MFDFADFKKTPRLGAAVPEAIRSFQAFSRVALADGAISKRNKELIAIASALTTQCGYCLETHRKAAIDAGVSEAQLAEVTFVTSALRAGAALKHRTHLTPDETKFAAHHLTITH